MYICYMILVLTLNSYLVRYVHYQAATRLPDNACDHCNAAVDFIWSNYLLYGDLYTAPL